MLRTECPVPLADLASDAGRVPLTVIQDGSGTARGEGTKEGWIHGLAIGRLFGPGYDNLLPEFEAIRHAIMALNYACGGELKQVMLNVLGPECSLERHRDGEPKHNRYHLPIVTDPEVFWWDELDGKIHMEAGYWYGPVNYCGILHSMTNGSEMSRVHLIADLEMV